MRLTFLPFKTLAVLLFSMSAFFAQAGKSNVFFLKQEDQAWLKKIHIAAQKLNYSGTFVYQQGTQFRTSRITHVQQHGNEIEKLEILDGKPREYIRNNDEIISYVSETKRILVEKRVTKNVFPAIFSSNPENWMDYYQMKNEGVDRVAGVDCQVVLFEPKDTLRYGYKLWIDQATGLLLRAQTLNEKNEMIEQITFTQIFIGKIHDSRVKSSFSNVSAWRVEKVVMQQVNLDAWSVKWLPPGFIKTREMKRLVSDASGKPHSTHQREVSQIVFSDGFAAISVFIESGTQSLTEGSTQQGAMNMMGKRQGDFWITIVGEVPALAIRQVADSIEYKK